MSTNSPDLTPVSLLSSPSLDAPQSYAESSDVPMSYPGSEIHETTPPPQDPQTFTATTTDNTTTTIDSQPEPISFMAHFLDDSLSDNFEPISLQTPEDSTTITPKSTDNDDFSTATELPSSDQLVESRKAYRASLERDRAATPNVPARPKRSESIVEPTSSLKSQLYSGVAGMAASTMNSIHALLDGENILDLTSARNRPIPTRPPRPSIDITHTSALTPSIGEDPEKNDKNTATPGRELDVVDEDSYDGMDDIIPEDEDDINDDDEEARYHGVNAYLSTDIASEAPCIYNVIRESNTISIDTSHAHTLDCPVSASRTPFSMFNDKMLKYYTKKQKREDRQRARAASKSISIAPITSQTTVPVDSMKIDTIDEDNNVELDLFTPKPLDPSVTDDKFVSFAENMKSPQPTTPEELDHSVAMLPKTDEKNQKPQTSEQIELESQDIDDFASFKREDSIPKDLPSPHVLTTATTSPSAAPASPSLSTDSAYDELEAFSLQTLQKEAMDVPLCTCGGGDDIFAARQCSVDLRADFIQRLYTNFAKKQEKLALLQKQLEAHNMMNKDKKELIPKKDIINNLYTERPLLLKVFNMTWNLFGTLPTTFAHVLQPSVFDMYMLSFQECGTVSQAMMGGHTQMLTNLIFEAIATDECEYVVLAAHSLQTIYTFVIIRTALLPYVHGVTTEAVATGYADMFGNKGAAAIRFFIGSTSFCVIGCHFNSGQNFCEKRNQDFHKIAGRLTLGVDDTVLTNNKASVFPYHNFRTTFRTTSLSAHAYSAIPQEYKQFYPNYSDIGSRNDITFWMGDLNYRIHGTKHSVEEMLAFHRHFALLQLDQLREQSEKSKIFYGFREGVIAFPPTYKYDPQKQCYDTSTKQRIPSWTDRILVRDNCTYCNHERGVCDCVDGKCVYVPIEPKKIEAPVEKPIQIPEKSDEAPEKISEITKLTQDDGEIENPAPTIQNSENTAPPALPPRPVVLKPDNSIITNPEKVTHYCERVLLEKYGCIQHALESDHRPVYAHFLISLDISTYDPQDIPYIHRALKQTVTANPQDVAGSTKVAQKDIQVNMGSNKRISSNSSGTWKWW